MPEDDIQVLAGLAPEADRVVLAAGHTFVLDVLGSASPGSLAAHGERVASITQRLRRKAIPLLVVPFMTEAGRRTCEGARISWFDLSGNAHIVAPGIRIIVDGRPNRFRGPGRPASLFAPKSARVVRWLLMHEGRALTQRQIARATDMSEGFVSRIVSRLEHESYVIREPTGSLRVKDPQLLLDAWREEYRFDKHTLIQGHVAARSGDALTRFASDTLSAASIEHAATGLAAAWQLTHFAAFRIATFFLAAHPSKELKEKLGFREEARGANFWLVVPNDIGVFQGAKSRDGVRCVDAVQAYLDLKAHPERASEAAERLRAELLTWRRND
ncbi:type IV toxin-antitoxin system AbiEi family antitoxin [Sorangium sp. So ce381]|uniref:type IV toxin-antitoxin system AbiEi family antitoxin n=1 Tax=Sorangium sp. So ce381 TaxID=3133307 RepID=UPI003F5B7B59